MRYSDSVDAVAWPYGQRVHRPTVFAVLLLCTCWMTVGHAQKLDFRDFVVEGGAVGATQVEVLVVDSRGEALDGALFDVKDDRIQGALPLPLGVEVELRAKAMDEKGEIVATGVARANFADMHSGTSELQLLTKGKKKLGALLTTPFRLEVSSEPIDEATLRFTVQGFDARGERIAIPPEEVSWFPFPTPTKWIPCKLSGVDSIACIEIKIPLREPLEVIACRIDAFCSPGSGSKNGYTAISAGNAHTCALTTLEEIVCWGSNQFGQLGTTTSPETCRFTPPLAQSLSCSTRPREIDCPSGHPCRWIALDAGANHTCAIDIDNYVWCWGENTQKQLGCVGNCPSGTLHEVLAPYIYGQFRMQFTQVSAGKAHTCALSNKGTAVCWGANTPTPSGLAVAPPTLVGNSGAYAHISAGTAHSCAVTHDGELECWGYNDLGAIENRNNMDPIYEKPVSVRQFHASLVGPIDRVAAGFQTTCAHSVSGGVACWGGGRLVDSVVHASTVTDLELSLVSSSRQPVCDVGAGDVNCGQPDYPLQRIAGLPADPRDTTIGAAHYCSVHEKGKAFCWGSDNTLGQMGDGTRSYHTLPAPVIAP